MCPRLRYHGPEVRWMPRRRKCKECGALVDWRQGAGRVYVRRHFRADQMKMEYCIEVWESDA